MESMLCWRHCLAFHTTEGHAEGGLQSWKYLLLYMYMYET
jgi:hypothetical protein